MFHPAHTSPPLPFTGCVCWRCPPPLQLRYIVYVPQAEAPDEDDIADAPTTISEDTNRRLDEILASSQASTATRISDAAEDAETR